MLFAFVGSQISCFPPSNFTVKQAAYVDMYCWDSLMHHEFDESGNSEERSLWVHKVWLNVLYIYIFTATKKRYSARNAYRYSIYFLDTC